MSDLYVNCPCCGRALDGVQKCRHCRWSPNGPDVSRAMIAYGFFLLLMLVLGVGVFLYVRRFVPEMGP